MFDLFWNLHQQRRINDANATAADTNNRVTDAQFDVRHIGESVERLSLITMAMWSLIQEKTDLTEQDLLRRVQEIDLEDGVADGKYNRTVTTCPKCNRPYSAKHSRCLYCGFSATGESAFERL